MVADLLTKPLAKDIFKELKYKLLYGFGGDVENIGGFQNWPLTDFSGGAANGTHVKIEFVNSWT